MRRPSRNKRTSAVRTENCSRPVVSRRVNQRHAGFTLIELLVAIGIIGFMASMVVFTMAGAQTDAKISRTEATIQKLNTIIMERWEGYRYRAVPSPIEPRLQRTSVSDAGVATKVSRFLPVARLVVLRELMRSELPDNLWDVKNQASAAAYSTFSIYPVATADSDYIRNYFSAVTANASETFQDAECLYAIVAHIQVEGIAAIENFRPSEIGDVDGDNFPEFIDAWGNPIGFIRWPDGFQSELSDAYRLIDQDAFDPLKLDPHWQAAPVYRLGSSPPIPINRPYTMFPLIYSRGPDGTTGMQHTPVSSYPGSSYSLDVLAASGANRFVFDNTNQPSPDGERIRMSPFNTTARATIVDGVPARGVGQIIDATTAADNITNHDLMVRQY